MAQNSDLGLLIGISGRSTFQASGGARFSSSYGGHLQLNYAFQFKETPSFRFYVEVPLLLGYQSIATVTPFIYATNGNQFYLTPGIRVNLPLHSRVSLYGAAGGGVAGFGTQRAVLAGDRLIASNGFIGTLAGSVGGGVDLRLSRLMSVRAEARDFIAAGGPGSGYGRNHLVYSFGVGFHW